MEEQYRFEIWLPMVFVVLGLLVVGLLAVAVKRKSSWGRLVPGLVVVILMWAVAAPTFYWQRVTLSDDQLSDLKGIWLFPEEHVFERKEIESIEVMMPKGDSKHQLWLFMEADGGRRLYRPGGLLQKHAEEVFEWLREEGIEVEQIDAEG